MFLLLIDANHIFENVWRASSKEGRPDANSFYQKCLASVERAVEENNPSHVLFAINDSAHSFRKERNPEYRFGQWVLPESYRVGMFGFRHNLKKRGISFASYPGAESRDIIATVTSKISGNKEVSVGIVGTNKAYLPLISEQVVLINNYAKFPDERTVRLEDIEKRFGFTGDKVLEMLVLEGDTEQGIPGAKGVGRKRAVDLMHGFGSLAAINEAFDEVPESLKAPLKEFFEGEARKSYSMWRNVSKLKLGFRFNDIRYGGTRAAELAQSKGAESSAKIA